MTSPQTDSQFVTANGARIHYKIVGSGEASMVFVHGLGCDLHSWSAQVSALPEETRAILIDLPGHGASDAPIVEYTVQSLADAVLAVMEATETEEATIVGHSYGVLVARDIYRRFPAKICGLVAIDGLLHFEKPGFALRILPYLLRTPLYRLVWRALTDGYFTDKSDFPEMVQLKQTIMDAPRHVMAALTHIFFADDVAFNDPVRVPVLGLYVRKSPATDALEDKLRANISDLELGLFDDCGHFLQYERREPVNRMIAEFVAKVSRR